MECYLENCENKSSVFEDVGCMQHYANSIQNYVNSIQALIPKMMQHSLGKQINFSYSLDFQQFSLF